MRIHTDTLTATDLYSAALIARADLTFTRQGSRSRDHSFDIHLTGESRRRTNRRGRDGDAFAATWDQWGVFLSVLFTADQGNTPMTCKYYPTAEVFDTRTSERFNPDGNDRASFGLGYWPADAHGDHTFRFEGTPYEQGCTKCSAVVRYGPY